MGFDFFKDGSSSISSSTSSKKKKKDPNEGLAPETIQRQIAIEKGDSEDSTIGKIEGFFVGGISKALDQLRRPGQAGLGVVDALFKLDSDLAKERKLRGETELDYSPLGAAQNILSLVKDKSLPEIGDAIGSIYEGAAKGLKLENENDTLRGIVSKYDPDIKEAFEYFDQNVDERYNLDSVLSPKEIEVYRASKANPSGFSAGKGLVPDLSESDKAMIPIIDKKVKQGIKTGLVRTLGPLDVGAFLGEQPVDPLNYVGIGEIAKPFIGGAKMIVNPMTRGAGKIAEAALGAEKFGKIVYGVEKQVEKIQSAYNKGFRLDKIFKKYGLDGTLNKTEKLRKSQGAIPRLTVKELFKDASPEDAQEVGKFLLSTNDSASVALAIEEPIIKKEIAESILSTELAVSKLGRESNDVGGIYKWMEDATEFEQEAFTKNLSKARSGIKKEQLAIANAVKNGTATKKDINRYVNQVRQMESEIADTVYKGKVAAAKSSIAKINSEIEDVYKVFSGDKKALSKYATKEFNSFQDAVNDSFRSLKKIDRELRNGALTPDIAEEAMESFRSNLMRIRSKINPAQRSADNIGNNLVMRRKGMGWKQSRAAKSLNKPLSKSQVSTLWAKTNSLLEEVNSLKIAGYDKMTKEVVSNFQSRIKSLVKDSNEFKNIVGENLNFFVKNLKSNTRAATQIGNEISEDVTQKILALNKAKYGLYADLKKSKFILKQTKDKLAKTAKRDADTLFQKVYTTQGANLRNQAVQRVKSQLDNEFAKGLGNLTPKQKEIAVGIRNLLDEYAGIGLEEGWLKGKGFYYFPRQVQKKFKEVLKTKPVASLFQTKGQASNISNKRKLLTSLDYDENQLQQIKSLLDPDGAKNLDIKSVIEENSADIALDYIAKAERKRAVKIMETAIKDKFGKKIPKDLAYAFDKIFNDGFGVSNMTLGGIFPFLQKVRKVFDGSVTLLNPAYYARNFGGNTIAATQTAGFQKGLSPDTLANAMALLQKNTDGFIKTPTGKVSLKEARDHVLKSGLLNGSFTKQVLNKQGYDNFLGFDTVSNILKSEKSLIQKGKAAFDKVVDMTFGKLGAVEDFGRAQAYVANIKKGMSLDDAVKAAYDDLFDYDLTLAPVDKMMQSVMSFYTYRRKNLPRQIRNIWENTYQYATFSKIVDKLSRQDELSDEEVQNMNTWDRDTLQIVGQSVNGIRRMRKLGFLPVEEAFSTAKSFLGPDDIYSKVKKQFTSSSVALNQFMDTIYGKDLFTGKNITQTFSPKLSALIPEKLANSLGLVKTIEPVYRYGERTGDVEVYAPGESNIAQAAFAIIQTMPTSAIKNLANFTETKDALDYIFGFKDTSYDINLQAGRKQKQIDARIKEAKKRAGFYSFENVGKTKTLEESKKKKGRR